MSEKEKKCNCGCDEHAHEHDCECGCDCEEDIVELTTDDGKIYDFSDDGDAAYTGTVTEEGLTIVRVYEVRAKATVTVRFTDTMDGELTGEMV